MSWLGRVGRCDYSSSCAVSAVAGVTSPFGAMRSAGARSTAPNQERDPMARELEGKVAVVTGAASGIGLASTGAMLAAGSRVMMVDRDEAALKALCNKHGDAVNQPGGRPSSRASL